MTKIENDRTKYVSRTELVADRQTNGRMRAAKTRTRRSFLEANIDEHMYVDFRLARVGRQGRPTER